MVETGVVQMVFLNEMIAQPGLAAALALTFWLISFYMLRSILSELLQMHKSKTAVKKIRKQYTFRQKLALRHVADHTEHAVTFARRMILVHHLSFWTMLLCLLSKLILSGRWFVYLLVSRFLIFDVPVWVFNFLLDPHPFSRRKRRRSSPFRFNKYHNTSDKTSLF